MTLKSASEAINSIHKEASSWLNHRLKEGNSRKILATMPADLFSTKSKGGVQEKIPSRNDAPGSKFATVRFTVVLSMSEAVTLITNSSPSLTSSFSSETFKEGGLSTFCT